MLSPNRVDLGKNVADLEVDLGEVDGNGLDGNPPFVARGQHLADLSIIDKSRRLIKWVSSRTPIKTAGLRIPSFGSIYRVRAS
ncbi:hypothetical protein EFR42_07200 [Lactobacillus delbrueckii]|nr:hypothetical protein [Lactobacillus delbrueckii]